VRFSALRNIWPFLKLVWKASPPLMVVSMALRLVRAVLPVSALWIGKLIVDEVVRLSALPDRPADLWGWWTSDALGLLISYVLAEFALAILSDVLGRVVGLVDSLLSDRLTMSSSIQLMEHAATGGVSKACWFALCSCGSVRYAEPSEARGDPPCPASIRPNSAACLPA